MRHPRDFNDALAMINKTRTENNLSYDSNIIAAAIIVLADSIMASVGTHGDDIIKAGHDVASSIEMAGK